MKVSDIAMPEAGVARTYLHRDIFSMAAAYLFHLVKNHPFVDGNKRIGLAAAYVFLAISGYELTCDPDELADMVIAVACGTWQKDDIAVFFRNNCRPSAGIYRHDALSI